MTVVIASRADMTLANCRRVAWGLEGVEFSGTARTAMAERRRQFMALVENPQVTIYGVNTGYGHQGSVWARYGSIRIRLQVFPASGKATYNSKEQG